MAVEYGRSWVEICNKALSRLGTGTIQSLTNENVNKENARLCNQFLGEAIEDVYSQFDWKHAIKMQNLARLEEQWDDEYLYPLPSDAIRIVSVYTESVPYTLTSKGIKTSASSVRLTYVAYPTDPALIPGYVRKALSAQLAAILSTALTSNESIVARMQAEAALALETAKRDDQAGTYENIPSIVWYDEKR